MTIKNIQASSKCQPMTSIMHYQSQNAKSTVKPKDSIESAKSCRSFGQCILQYFIFVPLNFIGSIFKTIIWAITFGTFFSRTFDLKKVYEVLEKDVYPCFNNKKSTDEQLKAAWNKFVTAFPGYPDMMVEELINAERDYVLQEKEKVKQEKIAERTAEWNKTHLESKRKSYSESISVDYDPAAIRKYMDLLDKKIKATETK